MSYSYSFAIVQLIHTLETQSPYAQLLGLAMATPRNNLQDQRSRLQQLGVAGAGSPFGAGPSPLVAGRVRSTVVLSQRCIQLTIGVVQRGNAPPQPGAGSSSVGVSSKPVSSIGTTGLRVAHHGKILLRTFPAYAYADMYRRSPASHANKHRSTATCTSLASNDRQRRPSTQRHD